MQSRPQIQIVSALEKLIGKKPAMPDSLVRLRETWSGELRDIESGIYMVEHMPIGHALCAKIFSRRHELQLLVALTDFWNEIP